MKEAKLFVISGPSGTGAADIIAEIFAERDDVSSVLPITARKMKAGEVDGVGFRFFDLDGWNELKQSGDLLEQTVFAGNDYGTSRKLVEEKLNEGKSVILSIEASRAEQIKKKMPEAVCVYMSPSEDVLRKLYNESARNWVEANVRMEMAEAQEKLAGFADKRICLDDNAAAKAELIKLIDGE